MSPVRWMPLLPVMLLAGCAGDQTPSSLMYNCKDGTRFTTRGGGEEITLVFEDRTVTLPRVHSGSGAKYTDRELLFWEKGDEAILSSGHSMIRCQPSR